MLARADTAGRLRFATRDTEYAERLFARRPHLRRIETIIYVAPDDIHIRSTGALRGGMAAGGRFRLLAALLLVPRFIRDPVYDLIAQYRRRLFPGEVCELGPDADRVRERMLS